MSKRRLTNREQLRKMLKEAEQGSILHSELLIVSASLNFPRQKAVSELLKLLTAFTQRETQWFIARVLGKAKDQRVIRPLLRAALAPKNTGYSCDFLWPLTRYDCTQYAGQVVRLLLSQADYGEAAIACVEIIRAMKGPFEPLIARRLLRQLFAEADKDVALNSRTALYAFRLEAAEHIEAIYFNHTRRVFWSKYNGDGWPPAEESC